jgi:hypothetical protein
MCEPRASHVAREALDHLYSWPLEDGFIPPAGKKLR